MISFCPGPSRVYAEIPRYLQDACSEGIMSIGHRSDAFMRLMEEAQLLVRQRLAVPDDYSVYFLSSATECWEIIAQSLVTHGSLHVYNGAFGKKWFYNTQKITNTARSHSFDRETLVSPGGLSPHQHELVCITQNETSNGTQVSGEILAQIRAQYEDHIIAIDATSSMAGIHLNFRHGDVWFASVQKCFGLPAGLAVMISSPKARAAFMQKGEQQHYNSLLTVDAMMQKNQTTHTPNVLDIYLLMRSLRDRQPIRDAEPKLKQRYEGWIEVLRRTRLHHLVENEAARSHTIIAVKDEPVGIARIKAGAQKAGFGLGEGYGELKSTTFRIANFPAITDSEIEALVQFFLGLQR